MFDPLKTKREREREKRKWMVQVHNLLSENLGTRHVSEIGIFSDFGLVVRGIRGQVKK
jgi:hypothetical protein